MDGTLVDTGGAGRRAFERALTLWAGRPLAFETYDPSGRTDLEILLTLAARAGRTAPSDSDVAAVFDSYVLLLHQELTRGPDGGVCPGVPKLLASLSADSRWLVGLLTGNLARVAEIKMRHYGLQRSFHRLGGTPATTLPGAPGADSPGAIWGAYGDDDADRRALVPVARRRLREAEGRELAAERVIVIGDTERDIDCARAAGARVLAVATGRRSMEQLAAAAPDALLPDLSDLRLTLETLERLAEPAA